MPVDPATADAPTTDVPHSAASLLWRPVGARERNKRRTRLRIRAAALEMFEAHGFAGTTVEQIAQRANISPRTFFNHYSTKEECVVLPHHELSDPLRTLLRERPLQEAPLVAMCEACCALFSELERVASLRAQIIMAARLHRDEPAIRAADSAFKVVWEDTAEAVFRERGEPELDAKIFAVVGVAAFKTAVIEWAEHGRDGTIADALIAGFEAIVRGLGGSGGIPRGSVPQNGTRTTGD